MLVPEGGRLAAGGSVGDCEALLDKGGSLDFIEYGGGEVFGGNGAVFGFVRDQVV